MAEDLKKEAKAKASTAKGRFHRIYNRYLDGVNRKQDVIFLNQMLTELELAYTNVEGKYDAISEMLDPEDEGDKPLAEECVNATTTLYDELCNARLSILTLRDEGDETKVAKSPTMPIRVKLLDAPCFDGNIRDYASFKRDYRTHMVPTYGHDPYALRKCLTGEALQSVQGVDDDFDEMMDRLHAKYGRPEKVIDSILSRLRKIKPVAEGDMPKFIEMIEIVESSWLEMKKLDLDEELSTVTMISYVEKLLPPLNFREWALLKHSKGLHGGRDQFKYLIEYLVQQRVVMEYMLGDIRRHPKPSDSKFKVNSVEGDAMTENASESLTSIVKSQMDQQSQLLISLAEGVAQMVRVFNNSAEIKPQRAAAPWLSNKKCWYHDTDNHLITNCSGFQSLSVHERNSQVQAKRACFCCLKQGHVARNCFNKIPCSVLDSSNQMCGKSHHTLLHTTAVDGSATACFDITNASGKSFILPISKVNCLGQMLKTLWDSGANISLIAKDAARSLGLKGDRVNLKLTKAGNVTENVDSVVYKIPLRDMENNTWWINVYEIGEIMSDDSEYDAKEIYKLFPNISEVDITKPAGGIDILIGTDCATLLPNKIGQFGQLQLFKNQFGYGLCGTHPSVKCVKPSCNMISRVTNVQVNQPSKPDSLTEVLQEFLSIEGLGVDCPLKCGDCKCGKCLIKDRENRELRIIEDGLYLDVDKKEWTVSYPKIRDYGDLPNNYTYAEKRLLQLERKLTKAGKTYANQYREQIQDMFIRGVARKLEQDEIKNYKGPVHYNPHHEILKPCSISTPMRVVFDPSIGFMGHVLNDYWLKGPCLVNNLFIVLVRFRQDYVALVGDLSKMYNSVSLSIEDQHVHRFLWRDLNTSIQPEQYALTKVPFGDRPSGAITMAALRKTAQMHDHVYPESARFIQRNSYVDDLLGSFPNAKKANKIKEETEEILQNGGFSIKEWLMSGYHYETVTDTSKVVKRDVQKVLGMMWKPEKDIFVYQIRFNFSQKNQKNDDVFVTKENILSIVPTEVSPRMILSQIAGIYDPLGLVIPTTLEAKGLMRKICCEDDGHSHKNRWDKILSQELRLACIKLFQHLLEIESLQFRRCIKPDICMNEPTLIIFSDGSELAFGCCVYLRWLTGDKTYEANLLVAKNRIAPRRKITVPRLELCGAVLAARIRDQLVKEMDYKFSAIYHLVDSAIVRAQIQKESYGFCSFVATKVGEIQSKTDVGEWWWIPSEFNAADMTTRITPANEVGSDSVWQKGPTFLSAPIEDWPIGKPGATQDLPDRNKITLLTDVRLDNRGLKASFADLSIIDFKHFNNYNRLIVVTCMLFNIARSRSFKNCSTISVKTVREAEENWIRFVQADIRKENWKVRYRRLAPEVNKAGIIVVGTRMAKWLANNWNQNYFILLPYKSEFTWLYVRFIHEVDHAGIEVTLSKIRLRFWIPRCRKIIRTTKSKCVTCRKKYLEVISQQMGPLPEERLLPSPPFSYCAVDLFGPLIIKDTVKGRCRGKAFGVVFTDLCNKGCHIELAEGYDAGSFINVLRRFVSIRGYPNVMRSDAGSQLVATGKELKQMIGKWDWDRVYQFGITQGMQWETIKSADAPWENGCCEAVVKLVKKCLVDAIGHHVLTFSELLTVLYEVGNLINERPIGTKSTDPNEGSYLSPNDLLLGRSSNNAPSCWMEMASDVRKRWHLVQSIVNTYWKRWQRDYFHTLIIRNKWHTAKRNLQKGDLVLVKDSNPVRGLWKLAQVTSAQPGSDGMVRDVTLRYKNQSPGKDYKGLQDISVKRSVHKLVLLIPKEEQT